MVKNDSPGNEHGFDVGNEEAPANNQAENAANVSSPATPPVASATGGTPVESAPRVSDAPVVAKKKVKSFDDEKPHIITAADMVNNRVDDGIKELQLERLALQYPVVQELWDEVKVFRKALKAKSK